MFFTLLIASLLSGPRTPLKVDLNPPVDRPDILTRGWENWTVAGPSPSRTFGGVNVTFRSPSAPRGRLFKANLVFGATMSCDGVGFDDSVEMVITGLGPGPHALVTYHNRLDDLRPSRYAIDVDGVRKVAGLLPSTKSRSDSDVSCAFLELIATDDPVVVTFRSDHSGRDDEIIINGFEIDTSDPRKKAIKPSPADDDEHADADSGALTLAWSAPPSATSHDIYFGTDRAVVASGDRTSSSFQGNRETIGWTVKDLSSHEDYFWRVDEVDLAGKVTRGDVWHFRVRHLAFPGAEGYGRFARGGRGGRVIEVTNLDDSGPGSFREAVDAEGPRTVVFRVSGVIALRSPIAVRNPYLTVAGQTAPGDGICLRGYSVGTAASSSDIIMRHMRIRVGDESGHPYNGTGLGGDHSIMDHCSISWSMDEGLSTRTARNVTFQRCIISEALHDSVHRHPHAYAASIGGDIASFHHNLLAHCTGRNWSLAGGYDNAVRFAGYLDLRNNVVYNWQDRTTDGGAKQVNFVNNYYKPGPASVVFHIMKPDVGSPSDRQAYYITGNIMEGKESYNRDNWKGVFPQGKAPLSEIKSDAPFFPPYVRTTSAAEVYADVLADVGATLPRQDAIDRRIIREVRTGTFTYRGSRGHLPGIIDTQADLGLDPWPAYKTYDVPVDADHDGMPDRWERAHGLNPISAPGDFSDANGDPDRDGTTHLEDYLNELAARGPSPG